MHPSSQSSYSLSEWKRVAVLKGMPKMVRTEASTHHVQHARHFVNTSNLIIFPIDTFIHWQQFLGEAFYDFILHKYSHFLPPS